ncbi:MAG TPA: hypothetical protein PKC49_10625, partial [Phycisphaerae bacterium]|nr:hypothetical protein [Phycisphaerae bacterium]
MARPAIVILLGLAAGSLPGARAADLAQHLPQTAALYFGWSDLLKPLGLDTLDPNALTTMLKERFELPDDEERPAARLIQAALMAARGSGGLAVFVAPKAGGLDVQFAVVLDGGGDAAGLARRLDAVLPAASGAAAEAETLEGVALSRVPGPEEGVVYWGRHGALVLLAYGEAAARQTAACLAGKAAGLTDNAEFKQARARITPGKGEWMFCLFGDFTRVGMPQIFQMLQESGELGGPDASRARRVCDALALGDFRSYYWHVEQSDYGSRGRAPLR